MLYYRLPTFWQLKVIASALQFDSSVPPSRLPYVTKPTLSPSKLSLFEISFFIDHPSFSSLTRLSLFALLGVPQFTFTTSASPLRILFTIFLCLFLTIRALFKE